MAIRTFIVEDTLFIRELYKINFKNSNFEIVGEAATGEEAIKRVGPLSPDVVFVDLALPNLSGFDVIESLKKQCPQACIVVASSFNEKEIIKKALGAGVFRYLVKPFSRQLLLRVLSEIQHHLQQQTENQAMDTKLKKDRAAASGR